MKLKFKISGSSPKQQEKQVKGFTIIELLVSMTITLVIVGLLLGMTKIAVGAWQVTSKKTKSTRLASEVFEVVGRDLEGFVFRSGNNFEWLNISQADLETGEIGPGGGKNIANSIDVSFYTATPDRYDGQIGTDSDLGGDVSLVRYRLVYQDVIDRLNGTKPVYSLYRSRVEPQETFQNLLGQVDLVGAIDAVADIDDVNAEENLLADNIYDFTVSFNFEYTIPNGIKGYERVTVQNGGDSESLSIKGNEILVDDQPLTELIPVDASALRLASADISVFVISDGGMKQINFEFAPGFTNAEFSEFLKKHGSSYTRSVLIPQP